MLDDANEEMLDEAKAVAGSETELERERERERGLVFDKRASNSASFLCLGSAAFSCSLICSLSFDSSSRIRTSMRSSFGGGEGSGMLKPRPFRTPQSFSFKMSSSVGSTV